MRSRTDPDDDLYETFAKEECWIRGQIEKREHIRRRLGLCGRFLPFIVLGTVVLGALLYFEVFPGLYGELMFALGAFVFALALDLFSIYHYRHIPVYQAAPMLEVP